MSAGTHTISNVEAREIRDSRGNPTVEVTVTAGTVAGSFGVPSGASTGAHEAHELRDPDGRGVQAVLEAVNSVIAPALTGRSVHAQREIDEAMIALDGTPDKSRLGGNTLIGTSIACAKAGAAAAELPVFEYLRTLAAVLPSRNAPCLYFNLVNGGKHGAGGPAFQEYHMVATIPDAVAALELARKVQKTLREAIASKYGSDIRYGDEGGFLLATSDVREPLDLLRDAIRRHAREGEARLALDVAATSFYRNGGYVIAGTTHSKEELASLYTSLAEEFNLLSVEDPFYEEDFDSFRDLKGSRKGMYVVGDDLTVTNISRLRTAVAGKSINAVIIKPNQIGTLTETLEAMELAREEGIEIIVSHRSGETMDDFIADLAFAYGCFGLKAGAPGMPERMAKYERLVQIQNY